MLCCIVDRYNDLEIVGKVITRMEGSDDGGIVGLAMLEE